jgi:hypothetical protein
MPKRTEQLRDAMVWAHAAGCLCDNSLHRRAAQYLHSGHKRAQRLHASVFWGGYFVNWRQVRLNADVCSCVAAVICTLCGFALAPIPDDDTCSRVVIWIFMTMYTLPLPFFVLIGMTTPL